MDESRKQLAEVKKAISKILIGGQSYKIGDMTMTRADLSKLYDMQKELENEIATNESGGFGRHSAAVFFDRR